MAGAVVYLFLIFFVIVRLLNAKNGKIGKNSERGGKASANTARSSKTQKPLFKGPLAGPLASDGHRVSKDQDISCRRFGHKHEEFDTPRFIPHEDPEEGYIILNGVRMKLTEADNYENKI